MCLRRRFSFEFEWPKPAPLSKHQRFVTANLNFSLQDMLTEEGRQYSQLREITAATIKKSLTFERLSVDPAGAPGIGRIRVLLFSYVVRKDTSDVGRVAGPRFGRGADDPRLREPGHGAQSHDGCRNQRHAHVRQLRRVRR